MSRSTMSGSHWTAFSTASSPSAASQTTRKPGISSRNERNLKRHSLKSSTIMISAVIFVFFSPQENRLFSLDSNALNDLCEYSVNGRAYC